MYLSIPKLLKLNSSCLFGEPWNIQSSDLQEEKQAIEKAVEAVDEIRENGRGPGSDKVLFPHLPYLLTEGTLMSKEEVQQLKELQKRIRGKMDALVSIGIGGSYLGNQMLFDIFCGPYWNIREDVRDGFPQVFFAGNNVDPDSLNQLISYIRYKAQQKKGRYHLMALVISKSGTTIEPMDAIYAIQNQLVDVCDIDIITITDKSHGKLLDLSEKNHWLHFTVPEGIGGRFSVLSQVGIVFGTLCGIDVEKLLRGAAAMEEACQSSDWQKNPALALAAMKYIATKKYGIVSEVVMPYGDSLRSLGWWYAQLMAESLGKRYNLKGETVHYGRTLTPCVGTTDMHSMTQEHQEGKINKMIQFISVDKRNSSLEVECEESGKTGIIDLGRVITVAMKSNAEALASGHRMSCEITMPEISPYCIGGLLYFFMLAVAYEGAMAGINAFDQPGVEAYKKILHAYIRKFIDEE